MTRHTNKTRKVFGPLFTIGLAVLSSLLFSVHADFMTEVQNMNVDLAKLQSEKTLSRYQLTQLLNASECKDCITPANSTIDTYTPEFWSGWSKDKYFKDVTRQQAIDSGTNYYYCVAYVGANGYMNGYPQSTSPICAGKFCGTQTTTTAEFIQVIINLLSKYIFQDIQADWKQMYKRVQALKPDSYEAKTISANDRTLITQRAKACASSSCPLSQASDVATYLRYCMFNLPACGMESIGKVKQGSWPIAELNLLKKQSIIDVDEKLRQDIASAIDPETVISTLAKINTKIQCSFNNDYDCDGLDNAHDNCPNTYNPHQRDIDKDKIGDVCDPDIDGDSISNPVGIVDDQERIVINLRNSFIDNCLFVVNTDQADTNDNHIGDLCEDKQGIGLAISIAKIEGTAPLLVNFEAISKGNTAPITRDFGDGIKEQGVKVTHTFTQAGNYRVQASTNNATQYANAQTIIKVGESRDHQYGLQIKASDVGSFTKKEVKFSASYIGNIDEIAWDFNGKEETKKSAKENFAKVFDSGSYLVNAKAYSQGKLVAVSSHTIGIGAAAGSILKADMSNPDKGQKTTFSTTTFGFGPEKISYVIWNFGDGAMSKGQSLSTTHTYTLAGTKTVTQNIMLTNGQQMTNIITLYIVDKANFLSYALLSLPNVLIGNRGQQISFTNYIVGDKSRTPLLYLRQSDPDHTQQLSGANKLPFTTSQSYQSNSIYHPQTTAFINQCEQLQSSTTLTIHGNDMCLEAKIGNTLKKAYHCDLDRDSIPDMCDEDIDNDGKPNLLGIITSENASCTYGPDNTNNDVLSKHFKHICSLDNAPFTSNKEQLDLDGDGMGDVDSGFQNLDIINDGDQDGIIDAQDLCPSIHGMGSSNGCPDVSTCREQIIAPSVILASCNQCPCQFSAYSPDLSNGDEIKAILRDKAKKILYEYSKPRIVNF